MKLKFPLYAKILCWFFLNLVFLGVFFFVVARGQFHFGLDTLVSGPAGERMQTVTVLIAEELRSLPQKNWDEVLKRCGDAYHVQFYLFHNSEQLAGVPVTLPAD